MFRIDSLPGNTVRLNPRSESPPAPVPGQYAQGQGESEFVMKCIIKLVNFFN